MLILFNNRYLHHIVAVVTLITLLLSLLEKMFHRLLRTWPLFLLWLDLVYGFVLNLSASINFDRTPLQQNDLPLSPDIAFSWLQVITNGGLVLVISVALYILLQLNRAVIENKPWPFTPLRIAAIMIILVFSLPAWWQWISAIWNFAHGRIIVDWHNFRYLTVAILLLYPGLLCVWLLFARQHLPQAPLPILANEREQG